jgi:SAM-dependent methyltransferase
VNAYVAEAQPRFSGQLAVEVGAALIVDVGCGTGLITCELAREGYRVIGVDPAPAMLRVARQRPFGDRVRWIEGDTPVRRATAGCRSGHRGASTRRRGRGAPAADSTRGT